MSERMVYVVINADIEPTVVAVYATRAGAARLCATQFAYVVEAHELRDASVRDSLYEVNEDERRETARKDA